MKRATPAEKLPQVVVTWQPSGSCADTGNILSEPHTVGRERVRIDYRTDPPTVALLGFDCDWVPPDPQPRSAAEPPGVTDISRAVAAQIRVDDVPLSPPGAKDHPGITGMAVWAWYTGPPQVTVTAGIGPYTTTATLRPVRYTWHPCAGYRPPQGAHWDSPRDCWPSKTHSSTRPGRQPPFDSDGSAAATRWTYETKGLYTVRLVVEWEGTWTLRGPGGTLATGPLHGVRTDTTHPYHVEEIRSVLIG